MFVILTMLILVGLIWQNTSMCSHSWAPLPGRIHAIPPSVIIGISSSEKHLAMFMLSVYLSFCLLLVNATYKLTHIYILRVWCDCFLSLSLSVSLTHYIFEGF